MAGFTYMAEVSGFGDAHFLMLSQVNGDPFPGSEIRYLNSEVHEWRKGDLQNLPDRLPVYCIAPFKCYIYLLPQLHCSVNSREGMESNRERLNPLPVFISPMRLCQGQPKLQSLAAPISWR